MTIEADPAADAVIAPLLDPESLGEIVCFTWETFLGSFPIESIVELDGDVVSASIGISGHVEATIVMSMPAAAADTTAATLLGMELAELTPQDRDDAIGEIVNIVGGNVKGILSDDTGALTLSLPVVSRAQLTVPSGTPAVSLGYEVDGDVMVWEVHTRK